MFTSVESKDQKFCIAVYSISQVVPILCRRDTLWSHQRLMISPLHTFRSAEASYVLVC